MIPGTAAGTQRSIVRTVVLATSSEPALLSLSAPETVIEGFNKLPSRKTPFSAHAL